MDIRSFLAFELSPEIKQIIFNVSGEMKRSSLDVRWVKPGNIHLTIVFLGNIPEERMEVVNIAAEKVCRRYGPFNVSLTAAGIFFNRHNPRTLWIGLKGDLERMSYFKNALQKHLRSLGIKEEKRKFKPHLTLGRFRRGAGFTPRLDELLSMYQDLISPVCSLSELALFKSDLKSGGAVYSRLGSWQLEGGF